MGWVGNTIVSMLHGGDRMKFAKVKTRYHLNELETYEWEGPHWIPLKLNQHQQRSLSETRFNWKTFKPVEEPTYLETVRAIKIYEGYDRAGARTEQVDYYIYCRTDAYPLMWVWWWFALRCLESTRYIGMLMIYLLEIWGFAYIPFGELPSRKHIGKKKNVRPRKTFTR